MNVINPDRPIVHQGQAGRRTEPGLRDGGRRSSRARPGGRTRLAVGGLICASQDGQALPVFLLADLAAGELLGEQSLWGRRRFRGLRRRCVRLAVAAKGAHERHDAKDHRAQNRIMLTS
jgi:hypothetical protein